MPIARPRVSIASTNSAGCLECCNFLLADSGGFLQLLLVSRNRSREVLDLHRASFDVSFALADGCLKLLLLGFTILDLVVEVGRGLVTPFDIVAKRFGLCFAFCSD